MAARNPSIHVTLTDLELILSKLGIDNPKQLAVRVMQAAIPYSIRDRYIVTGDAQSRKQAQKYLRANKDLSGISVERFNTVLHGIRVSTGHLGVKTVERGSSQWLLLKEVCQIANEFSATFEMDAEEGAKTFIKLGLRFMKQGSFYGLGKFKYYAEKITNIYQAQMMIDTDPDKEGTQKFYEIWQNLVLTYASVERTLDKPEDYVCMVYGRLEADLHDADYEHWLTAQFEALAFIDAIPNLSQLFSDSSLKNYENYMTHNYKKLIIKAKKSPDEETLSFQERYQKILKTKTD